MGFDAPDMWPVEVGSALTHVLRLDTFTRKGGLTMTLPCNRCAHVGKSCIRFEGLNCCSECVKASSCCSELSEASFPDAEWRCLVQAQQKLEDDEESE